MEATQKITAGRFLSIVWTILVIYPVFVLSCLVSAALVLVKSFNHKMMSEISYEMHEHHMHYKSNKLFDFTVKLAVIISDTFVHLWTQLNKIREIDL